MAFQFLCPQGHLLQGDEAHMGLQTQCPHCGSLFLIPRMDAAGGAPSVAPVYPPGAPNQPGGFPPPGSYGQPGAFPPAGGYAQPGYGAPAYGAPGYPQPQYPQPGYPQPSYDPAAYPQPNYPQPGYPQPSYPQQGYGEPAFDPSILETPSYDEQSFAPPEPGDAPPAMPDVLGTGIGGPPGEEPAYEPEPEETIDVLHIPCPNGHELQTPLDILGQDVLCPHCRVQFTLQVENSVEYKEEMSRRDERRGRFWFNWAITAAVIVILGLVGMVIYAVQN